MIIAFKIILVLILSIVFYQDIKDRAVWVILFPIFAMLGTYLFYTNTDWDYYKLTVLINLGIIVLLLLSTYLISRYILQKKTFSEALGLGDVFFFIGFALSFPTLTFINFFVFSILFTFVFWKTLKWHSPNRHQTIPLAGSMSLFLLIIYIVHWTGLYPEIYLV